MVYNFMIRLQPFTQQARDLQGGRFDLADRIFTSLLDFSRSVQNEATDVRELVPEFYYLPEMYVNLDGWDFGVGQTGRRVHDVELPAWANADPYRFVHHLRSVLESEAVTRGLPGWLDLIFGYKQQGV
jgi:hypothetical protein